MKIFVTGTRGVPNIPGGVETHCQELYTRIVKKGHEVIISRRSSYINQPLDEYCDIKLIDCFAPKKKNLEAIVHTFLTLIKAKRHKPDILHIHAIGPSLLTPLARLMGFKVVNTNHGPDYDRQKWGKSAKAILRLGELLGGLFSNEVIVISEVIKNIIRKRCRKEGNLIYNGVTIPVKSKNTDFLSRIGVSPGKYILAASRFVPEKGFHDLIAAFKGIDIDMNLVIAGDADHENAYSKRLKESAGEDSRIVMPGYVTGDPLNQLFSNAQLFILPSYHEGLPIVLLEALSFGLPALVSDIPANKEVGLFPHWYFKCGDTLDLQNSLKKLLVFQVSDSEKEAIARLLPDKYNWDKIADQTISVYEKLMKNGKSAKNQRKRIFESQEADVSEKFQGNSFISQNL